MLQPRPSVLWLTLVLAALFRQALTDDADELLKIKPRIRRDSDGDVTVLSLEENGRLREPPLGIISSTARTFVNDGATTEFATQIIGTTVGRTYARLLSTGTRVYYDSNRHTKDPFIVFPSIPGNILPTKTPVLYQTAEPVTVVAKEKPVSLNEIAESGGTEKPEPVLPVRKEFSVKRNTEIKPAKVKPRNGLPTVTIKNEFSPSGYSSDVVEERKEEKKPRSGKGLFRAGVQVKNDFQKYDTVTYVGFADFTTTVGNTVIIFMPKTAAQNNGPVTSISGAATLRPEDAVVTTVKTFMSHAPGMATKTVTGHNLNMQTSLPTIQADIRASKAYNPVFTATETVPTTEEPTTSNPPTTNSPTTNPPTTNPPTTNPPPEPTTNQQPTTEQSPEHSSETTTEEEPYFEPSETIIPTDELKVTESLPISPTYATTKTQVFIPGDQPLGLAKSIAVIEAYDETTTYFTSFLFGTVINGEYTQLTQIASSTSIGSEIRPTSASSFGEPKLTTSEVESQPSTPDSVSGTSEGESPETTEKHQETTERDQIDKAPKKPSINYITRIIPSTIYQTYTYFTTFFIPNGDESTSVKSREVVTSEVKYITTSLPPPGYSSMATVSPTERTTTQQPLSDDYEIPSTTEETYAEPTPHLPEPALLNPTTEESTTEILSTTEMTTTEKAEEKENAEEEVEVIIKTLYTTYTYLTTFFQETTSSVKSREVVETNVVTTTIDSNFQATDPAVAGLLNSFSSRGTNEEELINAHNSEDLKIEPSSTEFLKTYTYYTTVFVDGETLIESHTEVVTESIQPTKVDNQIQFKTASAEENNVVPRREANNAKIFDHHKRKPSYGTISRQKVIDRPTSEPLVMSPYSAALQSSIDDAYAYDTTMLRDDRIVATQAAFENIPVEAVLSARDEELKKEAMLAIGMTPVLNDDLVETMVTDVTSSSSGGSRRPIDEYESDPNDQISSESNTEEIEPSRTPTLVLQTSYTTYTYFTTVYKGPSSYVISRLDTVTNVVTETVRPTEIEAKLSPEEATLPITYFTTFTYWTTLYKGKSTMITSREETVSNVVTPTLPAILPTEAVEMTVSPTDSPIYIQNTPAEAPPITTTEDSPSVTPEVPPTVPAEVIPSETVAVDLAPTTYYTTYTYFTTSYIGNETVINSHLETETNVVTPTAPLKDDLATETNIVDEVITSTTTKPDLLIPAQPGLQPTGLISTIRSSEINDGITTLFNTDVYGTYIDGLYAQVLESSTEIVAPTSASSSAASDTSPTGVVSVNEGKIVDADGISTTLFTTKAIGTYIDDLYAQVIESTTSVIVDEEKKTATPPLPSTTIVGSKTYTTGLVRLIEGSIVKDGSTTFYESRVIGTLIDGRYAQIIESTSSFKLKMESTEMPSIIPTPTPLDGIQPTIVSTSPSSSVIESSQSTTEDEENSSGTENPNLKPRLNFASKTKASKASIRPFASRPRPTFQPKRKDPATTITRTSFTPTVTATPASKTKGFGSSRNRFAVNRSKWNAPSPQQDIKPTTSSSRRFSRTRGGSSSSGFTGNRARPSSSVRPTLAATSSSRRAGFNYRSTGAVRPTIGASSARFRIRPTQALGPAKTFASATTEDINNDINQISTEVPDNSTPGDEETPTTSAPTTTESPRRANNPLLRFRRPPILQRASTTTTTSKPTTTAKRSSLLRRPDSRAVITTTPKARQVINYNRKPRPGNSLFPARGIGRKPANEEAEEKPEEEEEEEEPGEDQGEIDIQDNEYEGSETSEQHSSTTTEAPKVGRRGKGVNIVSIRPFARRPRVKRQVEYGSRGYTPKFRRNKARTTAADFEDEIEITPEPPTRQTTSGRYHRTRGRSNFDQTQQQQRERVRPSPVTNTPRHQFTLRERSQTTPAMSKKPSSYRRTTSSPRRRTEATTSGRIKAPRLRTQTTEASSPRTTSRRFSSTSRGSTRTTSRARYRDNSEFDSYSPPPFDGTITVTHRVPTEVTIPIVNGKNTEYKNVITAKPSLETLGPYQYTTTTKDGKPIIQLTSEITSTLVNGLMEVTKYLVYETPTTSITFTPTTLRGRKTSFSHVVPSTVYEVRPEVSTVQPSLGNAPLANLLLSQLLLGNLGIPNTAGQVPQSPTTEFKTKTTTYVTTVTSHTSTILPLTFRGKEITTTIVDSSTEVITATEYITETVVITPTAPVPINNQLNTLLLPALLQAQLLQQNTPPPIQNNPPQFFQLKDPLTSNEKSIDNDPEQRFASRDEFDENERKIREYDDEEDIPEVQTKPRKKGKIKLKNLKQPDKSTSVVTLYVSGKHPGEFTTLLSTLVLDDTSNLKKREINYNSFDKNDFLITASRLPELNSSEESNPNSISPPFDVLIESSEVETQSPENVRTKHLLFSTLDSQNIEETITGHFLSKGPADSAPEQRAATIRSISLRNKREAEEQPRRRRIRVRVPVKRYRNETGELPSESLKVEDFTTKPEESDPTESPLNPRRVKVIKKKLDHANEEPHRKRVLIKKTKVTETLDGEYSDQETLNQESVTQHKRKRILVTKKKISPTPTIEPTAKKRLKITRKRPLNTEITQSESTPTDVTIFADSPMATLYNYHYSIPSDINEGNVMVSEIFMSGPGQFNTNSDDISLIEDDYSQPEVINAQEEASEAPENEEISTTTKRNDNLEEKYIADGKEENETITTTPLPRKPSTNPTKIKIKPFKRIKFPSTQQQSTPEATQAQLTTEETVYLQNETISAALPDTTVKSIEEPILDVDEEPLEIYDEDNKNKFEPIHEETEKHTNNSEKNEETENEKTEYDYEIENYKNEYDEREETESEKPENTKSDKPQNEDIGSDTSPYQENEKSKHANESEKFENNGNDEIERDNPETEDSPHTDKNISQDINTDPTNIPNNELNNNKASQLEENLSEILQPSLTSENPSNDDFSTPIQYHYTTRLTTTTRFRTYTYVVTRVSGNEHIVTSSTAIKPDIKTVTVSDLVPIMTTASAENEEGRAYLGEARFNLATKRMSNGVEVIVAGDKSTLPGQPNMRIVPTGLVRPITLAPSTLTDHMMMLLPQESQQPHNEFVTKTYMTTYTYLTTFSQDGSTVVSSREKVISNVVTEEIKPSKTKVNDHFTLTASPDFTTGVYHTTYTYLNTLVDGELPLVVTSKKTVANTVTEQPSFIQPSEVPLQDTNTYLSTVAYTRTLNEGDNMQIISTEDVLTQVVITEADILPTAIEEQPSAAEEKPSVMEIKPTPITTDITKTYFATYTYYKTKVDAGRTTVETEVVTSSDIATETFTLQPKRPKPIESSFESTTYNNEVLVSETHPLNLFATKTYLTTFTYFTTLLQENKTPSIVVSSSTEVKQNIVTETVNPSIFDAVYLNELRNSVNDKHEPVVATATLSSGEKMEITAMGADMLKITDKMDKFEVTSPSNIVTGSTIIFFDEGDQIDSQNEQSSISSSPQRGDLDIVEESSIPTTLAALSQEEDPTNSPLLKEVTEQNSENQSPESATSGTKKPVKNILQLSSLGINGLNALGPVINAMADLFQSKFNTAKKNVTAKPQPVYTQPPEEPPRPVYIPALDSEVAESQNVEGPNIFTDIHQRTRQTERPNIETALLSGGIPISPGQVITTNSDVIIGKPAVHGPRPPVKHFQKEVEGMKPPPPPTKGVWQNRDQERYPSSHIPHRITNPDKLPPRRDQAKPQSPQNFLPHKQLNKNNFIDLRHEGTEVKFPGPIKHKPQDSVPQSSKPIDIFQKPLISHKLPLDSHRNRRPSIKDRPIRPSIYPDDTTDLRPPALQSPVRPNNYLPNEHTSYLVPSEDIRNHDREKPSDSNNNDIPSGLPEATPPNRAPEPTFGHPLLVNIQPSQVANVIIPHGISTALIYNKEPEAPSQKGEIFNEPSAYPDAEVGIRGVAGLARPEDEILHGAIIPSHAVRMDVPVSPQGVGVEPITRIHKDEKKKLSSHVKKPIQKPDHHFPSHGLNYMTPPPPPAPALINYHLSGNQEILDQDVEYSLKNEYHTSEEDGAIHEIHLDTIKSNFNIINENNNKGELHLPGEIQLIPANSFRNYSDSSDDVSFSVINSKPVILGSDTPEVQPPIIKGRPGVSTFVNNSEATVSVGQMTNLQPNDDLDIPSNPLYNVHSTAIIRKPQPLEKQNHTKPFDNTVYTMNMDERPPLQAFGASPQKINFDLSPPLDMELLRLTPRPAFDQKSEANVMGLTPPALTRPIDVTMRPSRRPPNRKRPVPPYKFEIPVVPPDRVKKPLLPETEQPPPPPVPTEVLSPPKQVEETYLINKNEQPGEIMNYKQFTTPQTSNISPVLRGSLTVEEVPQKPEVITADSKVIKANPKITGNAKNQGNRGHQFSEPSDKVVTPSHIKTNTILASHSNELIVGSESVINDDIIQSSTEELSLKTKPGGQLASGSTTIFIESTTKLIASRPIKTTNIIQNHKTAIPLHISSANDSEVAESSEQNEKVRYNIDDDGEFTDNYPSVIINPAIKPTPTTHIITHTQTLTVTTTESRVIQSKGQKPSTHTLVVTKTLMSTILDTVTEVHTVVKPTSILSTVTTTIPQATTTVYPSVTTQQTIMGSGSNNKDKNPSVPQGYDGPQNKINLVDTNKATNHNHNTLSNMNDNDSILVVMTDKNTNHKLNNFDPNMEPALEIEGPEETNEIAPNVLLSGFLSQYDSPSECKPECRATRNERCEKINNVMRCVCRPGFARMFADQPCKPTYTYSLTIPLERKGKEKLVFNPSLLDNSSSAYQKFTETTKDGLDRMVMQSELRDVYHGLAVTGFQRGNKDGSLLTNFYIQLSENLSEEKIIELIKKHLVASNFSMGGTDLHASKSKIEHLKVEDFNECSNSKFHDCSENAQCFNLRGSYTCSCKEGFTDLSHNTLYPGRVCSADMIGCERCNFHGNCFLRNDEEEMCECFHWYAGQYCQINLKVLLLILVLVGLSLGVLLIVCLVLSCMKQKPRRVVPPGFRLRPPPPPDKRAMISVDTASEASIDPPPFVNQPPRIERPKPCRKASKAPSPPVSFGGGTLEQRDRSLTVMIPRAKYRPVPGSNLLTMSTFGPEQKLLKYLTPERQGSRCNSRKPSNSTNHSQDSSREQQAPKKPHSPHLRKPSTGALVSAGFEVSATVGRTKELQECFISEPHTDLGQPGFSTIRTADSSIIVDIPPPPTLEAELLDTSKVDLLTVSEVRSYDETTVHPATKSLRIHYDKNDDGHTMVERDIGSTFIMPQSQLFKPARSNGSDISNFDSL